MNSVFDLKLMITYEWHEDKIRHVHIYMHMSMCTNFSEFQGLWAIREVVIFLEYVVAFRKAGW